MSITSLLSLFSLRPYAEFCAEKMGYEMVGEIGFYDPVGYRFFPRKLSFSSSKVKEDPYKESFPVKINKITSRIGFSYADEGWHPFVETLKEYVQNRNLKYEDSSLALVYKKYCPKNVQEVLLDQIKEPVIPFSEWPPANDLLRWVWALNASSTRSFLRGALKKKEAEGWIFFDHTLRNMVKENLHDF